MEQIHVCCSPTLILHHHNQQKQFGILFNDTFSYLAITIADRDSDIDAIPCRWNYYFYHILAKRNKRTVLE